MNNSVIVYEMMEMNNKLCVVQSVAKYKIKLWYLSTLDITSEWLLAIKIFGNTTICFNNIRDSL
jgi:hypothetical protein